MRENVSFAAIILSMSTVSLHNYWNDFNDPLKTALAFHWTQKTGLNANYLLDKSSQRQTLFRVKKMNWEKNGMEYGSDVEFSILQLLIF